MQISRILKAPQFHFANLNWSTNHTHFLIVGGTGSGKSYFGRLLLGKIAIADPEAKVIVCDYKGDDSFRPFKHLYRYNDVGMGFQVFLATFKARQSGRDTSRNHLYLFFDEWAAYITQLANKEAQQAKKDMATLLMLGRSFNCHVIVLLQRADANLFSQGARDNFSTRLGLGQLSHESRKMLFPDSETSDFDTNIGQGQGYLLTEGNPLTPVVVPHVTNESLLYSTIQAFIDRSP